MSNLPVLESVRAAFAFRKAHWRAVGGVLAFAAAGATVETAGDLSGDKGLAAVGQLAYLVAVCMGYAALMRLAFADENPGDKEFIPGQSGFQWGRPEWRLIGVALLLFFAFMIGASLVFFLTIVISIAAGLSGKIGPDATPQQMAAALGPGGSAALVLLVIGFCIAAVYTAVRLSLAPAATIARGKIEVFSTWGLTKGQALRLIAATLLSSLPSILAGVFLAVFVGVLGRKTGAEGAMQVAMPLALIPGAVTGAVLAFVQLPVSVGLVAYLYRGLRPAGTK
jgi:hypothetical protein